MKEFDQWNEVKKTVHERLDNFGVHEREIWWVSLGINIGVETDGKHQSFERPVLILRKFNRQMAWVLPLVSRAGNSRFYQRFTFEGREYFVILTQIRTISTKRFLRKIGTISKDDFESIKRNIISLIQPNENPLLNGFSRRPKP